MNEPKYRLLQKGEKLQRGDQFRWDGQWKNWEGYEYDNSQIIGVRYRTQRPHQSEPKPKEDGSPVAGMTPEQMRIALAKEDGYVEQPDRFYIDRRAWMKNGIKHATIDIPDYHKDANATLEIVEMMRNRGWQMKVLQRNRPGFSVFLYDARKEHEAHADTLPLAICTAALKALGHLQ